MPPRLDQQSARPRHRDTREILSVSVAAEIRRLEIKTRRSVDSDMMGNYRSAFRGSGLIYSDVREYVPGDDVKHIHWNATARTGTTYVKSFDEDRQLRVLVAVDISNSTNHGATKTKHFKALEFAAVISMLAQRSQDSMGLCLFGGRVEEFIPPGHSRRQFQRVLLSILQRRTLPENTNLSVALEHLLQHQRKSAVIFLVSDFQSAGYQDTLRALALRHDVICVLLEDALDFDPPKAGIVEFYDAESRQRITIDTSSPATRKQILAHHQRRVEQLASMARSCGADFMRINTDPFQPLRDLMQRRRARQR